MDKKTKTNLKRMLNGVIIPFIIFEIVFVGLSLFINVNDWWRVALTLAIIYFGVLFVGFLFFPVEIIRYFIKFPYPEHDESEEI